MTHEQPITGGEALARMLAAHNVGPMFGMGGFQLLPFYDAVRELFPKSRPPFRSRPFDVQLIGAMVLHQGSIAEMKTGEGKTLAATLPLYLNALTGKTAYLVTVNDYLAQRSEERRVGKECRSRWSP